jgi:hypothetical protein
LVFLLSVVLCFVSAHLLFRRPIFVFLGGIFFLILNAVISVFIGCSGRF